MKHLQEIIVQVGRYICPLETPGQQKPCYCCPGVLTLQVLEKIISFDPCKTKDITI